MLRFIDGFDHYAWADLLGKWGTTSVSPVNSTITGSGTRTGAGALSMARESGIFGEWVSVPIGANAATVICGFGFQFTLAPAARAHFFAVGDAGVAPSQHQIVLTLTNGGLLEVWRDLDVSIGNGLTSSGTLLGSSVLGLSANQWYYLEIKATIHNTTGAVEVRVNGQTRISLSGLDTQHTTNAYANIVGVAGPYNDPTGRFLYDDLYIADSAGGDGVSDFLGPQRITTVIASSGNGTAVDWTPSTGTDHGALVDDLTPNGDTDYVSSSTVGHRDSFNYAALGITGAVTAVQAIGWAKIAAAGARAINQSARIAGTTYDGSTNSALDTTYRAARQIWTTSPATAAAWTVAEIDGAEFGVRVQA